MRTDLSGIYIFDQLDGDEKQLPTCIEDCSEEKRVTWLNSLELQGLQKTRDILLESIKGVTDLLTKEELVNEVNDLSKRLHYLGIKYNITK